MLDHISPDWETELQMVTVPTTTFAALTMGCTEAITSKPGGYLSETGKVIVGHIYETRLRVIENNLEAGEFPGKYNLRTPCYCRLKRDDAVGL